MSYETRLAIRVIQFLGLIVLLLGLIGFALYSIGWFES